MATYHSFDEARINGALETARLRHSEVDFAAFSATSDLSASGDLQVLAQCISVGVEDGKVCLNLPFGFGNACIPVPSWVPDGEAAQACLDVCTTWGVPTGIRVSVSVGGFTVVSQAFGKC